MSAKRSAKKRSSGALLSAALLTAVVGGIVLAVHYGRGLEASVTTGSATSASVSSGIPQADCFVCAYQPSNCSALGAPNPTAPPGSRGCGHEAPSLPLSAWQRTARNHRFTSVRDCQWQAPLPAQGATPAVSGRCKNRFEEWCNSEVLNAPQEANRKVALSAYQSPAFIAQCTSIKEMYVGHGTTPNAVVPQGDADVPYSRVIDLLTQNPRLTMVHVVDTGCNVAQNATATAAAQSSLQRWLVSRRLQNVRTYVEASPVTTTQSCQPRSTTCITCGEVVTQLPACASLDVCATRDNPDGTNSLLNREVECQMPAGSNPARELRKCCSAYTDFTPIRFSDIRDNGARWVYISRAGEACPASRSRPCGFDSLQSNFCYEENQEPRTCTPRTFGPDVTERCCRDPATQFSRRWYQGQCPVLPNCGGPCTQQGTRQFCQDPPGAVVNDGFRYERVQMCCPAPDGSAGSRWIPRVETCPAVVIPPCGNGAACTATDRTRACRPATSPAPNFDSCCEGPNGTRTWQQGVCTAALPVCRAQWGASCSSAGVGGAPVDCRLGTRRLSERCCEIAEGEFAISIIDAAGNCPAMIYPFCGGTCETVGRTQQCIRDIGAQPLTQRCCLARTAGEDSPEERGWVVGSSCPEARLPYCHRHDAECSSTQSILNRRATACDAGSRYQHMTDTGPNAPHLGRPLPWSECCRQSNSNNLAPTYRWTSYCP